MKTIFLIACMAITTISVTLYNVGGLLTAAGILCGVFYMYFAMSED